MDLRRRRKTTFALGLLFSACLLLPTYAQEKVKSVASNELMIVANSVVQNIAARIVSYQNRYLVFNRIDDIKWLSLSPEGFQQVHYTYPLADGYDLEVNVRMFFMDAEEDKALSSWRYQEFPILRLKIAWSTANTGFYLEGFDLNAIVEDEIWPLVEFQQKQLPLNMFIETPKTNYQVGEPVDLDLVVKNVSNSTLRVKPLDKKTLYCTMGDQAWGIKDQKPAPSKSTLRPGDQMRYLLKLKGLQTPGDFKISCSYGIGYQGVRPQARKVLKIEGNPIKDK